MRAVDLIMKKRSGGALGRAELEFLVSGLVSGSIPEYQASAWLMAVYFRGMTPAETAALTDVMLASGARHDLSGIPGPFVDKHSTGGVGDKTSLMLAPVVAAAGIRVPMMSGRSLGHTGGTLDKLDSIPGFRSRLPAPDFRSVLASCGFAMTGQSEDIVPADRILYALRDVTATVESIPLITASILSKKAAEGTEALVLDVKCGSGAFMKSLDEAKALATSLVNTWKEMGKRVVAVITSMDQPLGACVGNFLEVEEALDYLEGKTRPDLHEVTRRLGAWMLVAGGKAPAPVAGAHPLEAERMFDDLIASGKPRELFLRNVEAQGGRLNEFLAMRGSFRAPLVRTVKAPRAGSIGRVDAMRTGIASVLLGVGRATATDEVKPDVGIVFRKFAGEAVGAGEAVCELFGHDDAALDRAAVLMAEAIEIAEPQGSGATGPVRRSLIMDEIADIGTGTGRSS